MWFPREECYFSEVSLYEQWQSTTNSYFGLKIFAGKLGSRL